MIANAGRKAFDYALYWRMPGPRKFIRDIEQAARRKRFLGINMPRSTEVDLYPGIEQGVRDAGIERQIRLQVIEGTDIPSAVGFHFAETRLLPEQLARLTADVPCSIALVAQDDPGHTACFAYADAFVRAFEKNRGNVLLIVAMHIEGARELAEETASVVAFDGGLSYEEMSAYVALQMADRQGPGNTRLLKGIVAEFAGFDVSFAERLRNLSDTDILSVTDVLPSLLAQSANPYRLDSWLQGAKSIARPDELHTLRDAYLARSGQNAERKAAKERIETRYWRACLREITPYLEERQARVIQRLHAVLDRAGLAEDGAIERTRGTRTIKVSVDDLEYNDIAYLKKQGGLADHASQEERDAIDVCEAAKRVRDAIAHMRPPTPDAIRALTTKMDALLQR